MHGPSFSQGGNGGVGLKYIVCFLVIFAFSNCAYFLSQLRYEHEQTSLAIQGFQINLNRLIDREKRSIAHVTERFNELRTQVIDMEMEYDAMNDKIKQVKEIGQRDVKNVAEQVDNIGKKVTGIGVLLGRMPSLLQKVEAENRDSVETVNTKLQKLEGLLGNPNLRSYLNIGDAKTRAGASFSDSPVGGLLDRGGKVGGISKDGAPLSPGDLNIQDRAAKKTAESNDAESPSDLPQKPHSPTVQDERGIKASDKDDLGEPPLQGSVDTTIKAKEESDEDKTCELPKAWAEGPKILETYDHYMKTGERWLEIENFAKAIACFNVAEAIKKTDSAAKVGKQEANAVPDGRAALIAASKESNKAPKLPQ